MSKDSDISWTSHSFNPWWGCFKVSPGCQNCYAEAFSKRTGHAIWGPPQTTSRRLFGDKHWREPLAWNAAAERSGTRAQVFCASMADVFEDHPAVWDAQARLWDLIAETPALDWQLLTKRPENVMLMVPMDWTEYGFPENVWIGTSVENQAAADERLPYLLAIPAVVRFLSCEPLLGPVDLDSWLWWDDHRLIVNPDGLNWVMVGGESGPRHRPMDVSWLAALVDQCRSASVAVWTKQDSGPYPGRQGRIPDEYWKHEFPVARAAVTP